MSTFKDITYKKNDDETWTEWSKRVPDNDEDKLDYIGETIYQHTVWGGKGREITDLLLVMGVEGLIPLLESEELLDAKIEEAYEAIREFEEYKMTEEDDMFEEDCLSAQVERRLANEALRMANETVEYLETRREKMRIDMENHQIAWAERCSEIVPCVFCSKDTAKVKRECGFDICNDCFEVNKTSDGGCLLPLSHRVCWPRGEGCDEPELCSTPSSCNDDDHDYDAKQPIVTLTVTEMIEALSKLPPDAKLVMTEKGFYSRSPFAEVMLPKLYPVEHDDFQPELPRGTQVYIIGHSHQSY
jgi:hypothetical protein